MLEKKTSDKLKISLIDNNSISRIRFHKQLELCGHQIISFESIESQENVFATTYSDIYIFNNTEMTYKKVITIYELSRKFKSGIIVMSDTPKIEDRITALEQFADVYLSSSVDYKDLNAYIKSLYRRLNPIQNFNYKLNESSKILIINDSILNLSNLDVVVLRLFINSTNTVISRQEIAKTLDINHKDYQIQLNTIVSRLRNKLISFDTRLLIQTVREKGYVYKGPNIVIE